MLRALIASGFLIGSAALHAATPFVEVHGGMLGLGAEVGVDFGMVRLRAQTSQYDYDSEQEFDGVDFDTTLELGGTGVLVDFAPFGGSFYVTAGLYQNDVGIKGDGPYNNDDLGGVPFTGRVFAEADFDDQVPYVGLGWHFFNREGDSGLGLSVDLGAYVNGSADIDVTTDNAAFNATNQAAIDQEEKNIEDDVEEYDTLPVIKLGLSYYF